jgi:predicted component of type VI protein secretion system
MLAYAGILATPGRSPDVVCNLVSHCFDLPDVVIDNWQLRKVPVDLSQQNRLGVRYPGMPQRHQLADTVVNGFSTDPLQALRAESLTTAGDLLSGGGDSAFQRQIL